jgi:hypothetical protein
MAKVAGSNSVTVGNRIPVLIPALDSEPLLVGQFTRAGTDKQFVADRDNGRTSQTSNVLKFAGIIHGMNGIDSRRHHARLSKVPSSELIPVTSTVPAARLTGCESGESTRLVWLTIGSNKSNVSR